MRVNNILKSGEVKNIDKGFGGFGTNALIRAAEKNEIEIIKALVRAGSKVDYEAKGRETALHVASYYGYLEEAKLLIEYGANPNIPLDQNSLTPLHHAILKGHFEVAKFLVESGANVNAMTGDGRNAITMARREGNQEFISWIEQHKSGTSPE